MGWAVSFDLAVLGACDAVSGLVDGVLNTTVIALLTIRVDANPAGRYLNAH